LAKDTLKGGLLANEFCVQIPGDFGVVGSDITEEASQSLPTGPDVGPKERVIRIPRHVIIAARAGIPAA
jgi:hypothetical protein